MYSSNDFTIVVFAVNNELKYVEVYDRIAKVFNDDKIEEAMNLICDGYESVEGVNVLSSIPRQGLHPLLIRLLTSLMNNGVNVSMIDGIKASSYNVNKLFDLLKSNKSIEVKEVGIRNILVNDMNVNV